MKAFSTLMVLGIIFSFSTGSATEVERCLSRYTLGKAFVAKRGFAKEIKKVRNMCTKAKPHYEKADVIWNLSDRSYDCMVGNFCK